MRRLPLPVSPYSRRYFLVLLILTAMLMLVSPRLALVPFFFIFAIGYFFRDPERKIDISQENVLSPADGRVLEITPLDNDSDFGGPCQRVSIYLSFFDVHINRSPIAGIVTNIRYSPGSCLPAYKKEAFRRNENNLIRLSNDQLAVLVRQIAGRFTRRIICDCNVTDKLKQGQKIGMIQFGSGVEIYVPSSFEIKVSPGSKVKAGQSVIASFKTG